MDKKNISFVFNRPTVFPIGGFKVIYEYANRLSNDGIEVHIVYNMFSRFNSMTIKEKFKQVLRYILANTTNHYSGRRWFNLNENIKEHYTKSLKYKDICKTDIYVATAAETSFSVNEYPISTSDCIYTEDQIKKCKSLINKFDAVSVREESALKYCNDLFSYDKAKLVLDPTLLLNRTVYESLTKSDRDVNQGKLFCYILDNNEKTQDVIYDLCKAINIKASYVLPRYGRKRNFRHQNTICSVQSFLISLMNAKYVLTDSFHGCVFSIIFNKPFVCIGNEYRGNDRFLTLQKLFNIESRFTNKNDVESIKLILDKDLDWNQINNFKKHYVEESIKFIESSLNHQ